MNNDLNIKLGKIYEVTLQNQYGPAVLFHAYIKIKSS